MASWINGNQVSGIGGYVQFWNWKSPSSPTGGTPIPTLYNYLDVARWELTRKTISAPVWYGGCYGSIRRRAIALDWSLYMRVWWDADNPPEWNGDALPENFSQGDGLAIKLVIGNDANWTGNQIERDQNLQDNAPGSSAATINQQLIGLPATGAGYLEKGDNWLPCYCAPLGLLTGNTTADPSEGRPQDGIVVADLEFSGDSLMWFLPSQLALTDYANYVQTIAAAGLIPYG